MRAQRGRVATRVKDITDVLCGSLMLLAVWSALLGILAAPIYLTATFVEGLAASAWPTVILCIGVSAAEFYGLVLVLRRLDRRDESVTPF